MSPPAVARPQTIAEAVAAKLATAPPLDAATKSRLAVLCRGTVASSKRGRS